MAPLGQWTLADLTGNSQFVLVGTTLFIVGNTTSTGEFVIFASTNYGITATAVGNHTFTNPGPFDPAVCTDGTNLYIIGTETILAVPGVSPASQNVVWFKFVPNASPLSPGTLTGPVSILTGVTIGSDYDIAPLPGGSTLFTASVFSADSAWAEDVSSIILDPSGTVGTIVLIDSSPDRTGSTWDSLSLVTTDNANFELYATSHPKSISFQNYTMTLAVYKTTNGGATWSAASTLLTLPVRHVSSDLTVIAGSSSNSPSSVDSRWLSTTLYTQDRSGLAGCFLLGYLNDITSMTPWSFNFFQGTPAASIVEPVINVFTDNTTALGFITRDLTQNPPTDGIISVNTLNVANWQYLGNPAFRNPVPNASWLRGTKSILPTSARWGFMAEQRVSPGNALFYSGFLVAPTAAIVPTTVNPAFRNTSYTFDASTSFDLNFNTLEYEWALLQSGGGVFTAWAATTAHSAGDLIADSNGNVQICIVSGTTGATEPLGQWFPGTAYTTGEQIEDINGFIQQCTTGGTSGSETPTWNQQSGQTTGDGSVVWTNFGLSTDSWSILIDGITQDGTAEWATAITLIPALLPNTQYTTAVVTIGDSIGPAATVFEVQVGVIDLDANNDPIHTPPTGAALAVATVHLPFVPLTTITWSGNFISAPTWQASHAYTLGSVIYDGSHMQQVTTAGISGSSVPSFNHSGSTTTDHTATWTDLGAPVDSPASSAAGRNSEYTLTPTVTPGVGGLTLTYTWQQLEGSPVTIGSTNSPTLAFFTTGANFNNPVIDGLIFQLTVNDGVNVPVESSVEINVAPYIFNKTDTLALSRSNWSILTAYTHEAHTIPASAPYSVTVSHPPTGNQTFTDEGVKYTGGASLTLVTTPPTTGQYNVNTLLGTYSFAVGDASAAIQITYNITVSANISQRNTPQFWPALDQSAIITNMNGFKRSTDLLGNERFIIVSEAAVLVYGLANDDSSVLLRKLFIPEADPGVVEDAVHTELDYTVVLSSTNNLYQYITSPNINDDSPDTSLSLTDFVSLTAPTPLAWVATTFYSLGDQILDSNGNVQIVIQIGISEGSAPTWNTTRGGSTNDGPFLLWKNLGLPTVFNSVFATNTFANIRVIALCGPSGCFLMQFNSQQFIVEGFFEISVESGLLYGADNVQWLREANVESLHTGQVLVGTLDNQGRTFETLIDLTHRVVLGTWDASKLKNQYVTTGEILFEAESSWVGLPEAPVMSPATVNLNNTVSIAWTAERPDLITNYNVSMSIDGGAFNPLTFIGSGTVQSFITAALPLGHTYSFEVSATGPDGTSPFSTPVNAFVGPPQQPTMNQIVGVSGGSIAGPFVVTVTWSQQNPNADAVTSYTVQMSTDAGAFSTVGVVEGGANTTFSKGPLAVGHTYTFQVSTTYNGQTTAYSGPASITFPAGAEVAVPAQSLAAGVHTVAYSATIVAGTFQSLPNSQTQLVQYGVPNYTFAVATGNLPTGLTLEAATGVIFGTPTTPGTYNFTVTATDSAQPTPFTSANSPTLTIVIS